jgi:1,4-alpha-glucan branching enzyme
MWDFDFRDEVRRLVAHGTAIENGHLPSERASALVTGQRLWDDWNKNWRQYQRPDGTWAMSHFDDMAQRVAYNTSHDVQDQIAQRLLPYFSMDTNLAPRAFDLVHATFALLLTTVGIPMFLAGEEFGDLHDLPHEDWQQKMSDPVDWERAQLPGHRELLVRVQDLVRLRRTHSALHRNEVEFFGFGPSMGFHPQFDVDTGPRVFAYCRTAGLTLGSNGQVIVIANCGQIDFPSFWIDWPWGGRPVNEVGKVGGQSLPAASGSRAVLALRPFQVRVFST